MKSFTVTFHHTCNYGAILQSYALQKTLTNMGLENEVMEYPDTDSIYESLDFLNIKQSLKLAYINFWTFLRKKQMLSLRDSFIEFHKKYINTSRRYISMKDLQDNPPKADYYITGSDQVWNLNINKEFIPARFLDFGSPSIKRLSYAASIERMNYTDKEKEYVRDRLEFFSGISLREESAKKYMETFLDKKCEVVLDPVFLLTQKEWSNISEQPRCDGNYILCYQVRNNPRMQETLDILKKKTGLKTITINCSAINRVHSDEAYFDVSPEEFIGLFEKASIIVSASFHGAAFGLVFNKPTYALVKKTTRNRMYDLFSLFGIEDCIIDETTDLSKIVFNKVANAEKIVAERDKSLAYLRGQIHAGNE